MLLLFVALAILSTPTKSIAQHVQFVVEPTMRSTALSSSALEAGTKLFFQFKGIASNATVILQKCSEPCNSAKLIAAWTTKDCDLKEVQTVNLTERGTYYIWAQIQNNDGSTGPDFYTESVTTKDKSEFTFQSGGRLIVTATQK